MPSYAIIGSVPVKLQHRYMRAQRARFNSSDPEENRLIEEPRAPAPPVVRRTISTAAHEFIHGSKPDFHPFG
jgi:hypothetical protein